MKHRLIAFVLLSAALLVGTRLYSQSLNAIQTVVPFLIIAPDSRAGAMGDAGVATTPDVYSMHWNPAKFAFIDGKAGVGISYAPWLRNLVPDINIAYLTGYKRIDKKQVMSGSLIYSSLGDVQFTDIYGNFMMNFKPNELAIDAAYSRILTEHFSGGIAFRFIYSNLSGGSYINGESSKPGISFAADVSGYYQKSVSLFNKDAIIAAGFNFSNIGTKMSYSDSHASDFIPMNLRIGTAGTINLDSYNKLTFTIDLNKLLVPTPPIYYSVGEINAKGDTVKTALKEIKAGMDPTNLSVPAAIFQSFYDAPGGFSEELKEITYSLGAEYWYNNQFAIRGGYFHEDASKGNRKYYTVGAGFRMSGFTIDFSYLMPVKQNNPLARTLRFSLSFDLSALRNASKSPT
ncbi:MAG TPA: type IX secretion system outer membrane channel protein PorV [Bacteroidales bacterium]|nr:type IX secretion system outer membrane channel protein PorV [Bacteroidales bacterium]